MSYLVFARKFRPQILGDLVGQEHVATTLKNALKQGRIAQSFLFSGTRGVGKTSAARILAKMLNCEKAKPGDEPCGKCNSCEEITKGNSLDVLEIDGASNRGIDEIRNLRDNVKFKPMAGEYKVYIIDEVHMLTGEAFNALLKTLEEPPSHVKFIFATTEAHKVPLTILSRCQRFHFRRIAITEIVKTLEKIGKEEKIKMDSEALFLVAKQAEGSMRDAESLLEQMVSFCGKSLKKEDVEQVLGLSSTTVLYAFVEALAEKNEAKILDLIEELVLHGQDLANFSSLLLETFRALLLSQVLEKPEKKLEMSEEELASVQKYKTQFSKQDLFMILDVIQELNWKIKRSNTPRILLEITLLELAARESMESVSELIQEVKALRGGGVSVSPATPSRAQASPVVKKNAEPVNKASFQAPKPTTTSYPETPVVPQSQSEPEPQPIKKPAAKKSASEIGFDQIELAWQRILEAVKARKMSAGSFLAEGEPMELEGDLLVIGFPTEFRFHKDALDKPENKSLVEEIVQSATGATLRVKLVMTTENKIQKDVHQTKEEASGIISDAMEIFEGRILEKDA